MPKKVIIIFILHWIVIAALVVVALVVWQIHWPWVVVGLVFYLVFFLPWIIRWVKHTYHFPIPQFLTTVIDNPVRRRFIQNPQAIAQRMELQPGMIVVEIGPGNGSYTRAAANAIQPGGRLYAVDISTGVVERLKARFAKEGVTNVIPRIEDAHHFTFEDESVDRVLAVSCLPEIPDQVRVLEECRRILKPDGMLCLSELFIDPDYPLRRTEMRWAEKAGLVLKQEFGNWFTYQLHFGKIAAH